MTPTIGEARAELAKVFATHNYAGMTFVIVERKLTKESRNTWFGLRCFVAEEFRGDWYAEADGSFCRMIELVTI